MTVCQPFCRLLDVAMSPHGKPLLFRAPFLSCGIQVFEYDHITSILFREFDDVMRDKLRMVLIPSLRYGP
jgi:hypothetical protein